MEGPGVIRITLILKGLLDMICRAARLKRWTKEMTLVAAKPEEKILSDKVMTTFLRKYKKIETLLERLLEAVML